MVSKPGFSPFPEWATPSFYRTRHHRFPLPFDQGRNHSYLLRVSGGFLIFLVQFMSI